MSPAFRYISIFFLISGIGIAIAILFHIYPRRRQPMRIMEAVWPLTGLWANWLGLWAYRKMGKTAGPMKHSATTAAGQMHMPGSAMNRNMNMHMDRNMKMDMPARPKWQSITLSTLHCGAGCTLADILGETFTGFVPLSIGGSFIAGQWVLDYILALIFGIFFQYAAIRPMENLPRRKVIAKAFKVDFFSLTAWQLGMYGWMAICMFGIFRYSGLPHNSWEFWFMMQVAMFFGFLTSYPANYLLIRLGIKQGM